jgi:uncharacterized protein (DUF486 family)
MIVRQIHKSATMIPTFRTQGSPVHMEKPIHSRIQSTNAQMVIFLFCIILTLALFCFVYRISANSFPPSIVSAATIQFMKQKIARMRKRYENFHIFYLQKRLVSAEIIRGNTLYENFHIF